MRVAGHTYPYRDRPFEAALDELARLAIPFVEVWLGHAGDGPDSVAHALQERGLEAVAVSAGGFYTTDSDAPARAVELAQAIAAPVIVACVAFEVLDSAVAGIPTDIKLCVENHWDQPLATSRELRKVLETYRGTAACLDTGHAILAGETPEHFVDSLGAPVGHVHLKDALFPPLRERLMGRRLRTRLLKRPDPVLPGTGALDVGRVRRALESAHYEGAVTLEYEGTEPSVALTLLLEEWAASGEMPIVDD